MAEGLVQDSIRMDLEAQWYGDEVCPLIMELSFIHMGHDGIKGHNCMYRSRSIASETA